jgi:hypothetical protein
MFYQVDLIKEEEQIAKIERQLLFKWGLKYNELQELPLRLIRIWSKLDLQERLEDNFRKMKIKTVMGNRRANN